MPKKFSAQTHPPSYREQSLKIHGLICAKCGREFDASKKQLLTVHHKDGNHMNNPPDGANWELLCLYCHDDQHETRAGDGYYEGSGLAYSDQESGSGFRPFENLKNLLKPQKDEPDSE